MVVQDLDPDWDWGSVVEYTPEQRVVVGILRETVGDLRSQFHSSLDLFKRKQLLRDKEHAVWFLTAPESPFGEMAAFLDVYGEWLRDVLAVEIAKAQGEIPLMRRHVQRSEERQRRIAARRKRVLRLWSTGRVVPEIVRLEGATERRVRAILGDYLPRSGGRVLRGRKRVKIRGASA